MTLHERISAALGWTVKDVRSFSLPTLRELVRDRPKLFAEITSEIQRGEIVVGLRR